MDENEKYSRSKVKRLITLKLIDKTPLTRLINKMSQISISKLQLLNYGYNNTDQIEQQVLFAAIDKVQKKSFAHKINKESKDIEEFKE